MFTDIKAPIILTNKITNYYVRGLPEPETPSKGLFQDTPIFQFHQRDSDSGSEFDPNDVEASDDDEPDGDCTDDEMNQNNVDPQPDQEPTKSGKYITLLGYANVSMPGLTSYFFAI